MRNEIQKELIDAIIPFWEALRDDEYGGFYGYMDYDLNLDKKAEKGCILNSRITWFFASAYKALKDPKLLDEVHQSPPSHAGISHHQFLHPAWTRHSSP